MPKDNNLEDPNNADFNLLLLQLFFLVNREQILVSLSLLVKAIIAMQAVNHLDQSNVDIGWLNNISARFTDAAPFVNFPNAITCLVRAITSRAIFKEISKFTEFTEEDISAVVTDFLESLGIVDILEG